MLQLGCCGTSVRSEGPSADPPPAPWWAWEKERAPSNPQMSRVAVRKKKR